MSTHAGYSPQIGALLRMAWEQLQVELFEDLSTAGFGDLREAHRPLVRYPPIDGLRPTQLAERLTLSKQAVNDLLRDFESMGLIRLEPDAKDGRARIIRYTERGWRLFNAGSKASRRVGQRWAKQIGDDRYDAMVAGLKAICELQIDNTHDRTRVD